MPYSIVAVRPGGPNVFRRQDLRLESLSSGEVLVRHTAIGVNFIDVYYRTGLYPWPDEKNLILGSEAAGIVEEVGPNVKDFRAGDRVAYTIRNGSYSTHRVVNSDDLVPVPDDVSSEVAAAVLLKGLTVHYLVNSSFRVEAGHVVLFHAAAGGVGSIAGRWLKSKGAVTIGTAGGQEKCAYARSHGYDHMIDYNNEDFVQVIRDITEGAGVDVVYDSVGKDTYPGSLECLKTFGTFVNFGQSSGPALDFRLSDLAVGSFSVTRPILFHYTRNLPWLRSAAADLFKLIQQQVIQPSVNTSFDLSTVALAHEHLESRKSTGSIVLTVS